MKRIRFVVELVYVPEDDLEIRKVKDLVTNTLDGNAKLKFRNVKVLDFDKTLQKHVTKAQDNRRITRLIEWIISWGTKRDA